MAATVEVNGLTVVHRTSEGESSAFPDVCWTPPGPVPVPYLNTAYSRDAAGTAATVFADGQPIMKRSSYFATSTGDEQGTAGGIFSGTFCGKASFINYSFDVRAEQENVPRLHDPMIHNHGSPGNGLSPAEEQPDIALFLALLCQVICKCRHIIGSGGRTKCVEWQLARPRWENGFKQYWDPNIPGIYVEVPFDMEPPPPRPRLSQSQRSSLPPHLPLPAAEWPPIEGTRRPDIVIARDPNQPLTADNVARIIELKFEGDGDHDGGQYAAYDSMDPNGKALIVHERDCQCTDEDDDDDSQEQEQEQEQTQEQEQGQEQGQGQQPQAAHPPPEEELQPAKQPADPYPAQDREHPPGHPEDAQPAEVPEASAGGETEPLPDNVHQLPGTGGAATPTALPEEQPANVIPLRPGPTPDTTPVQVPVAAYSPVLPIALVGVILLTGGEVYIPAAGAIFETWEAACAWAAASGWVLTTVHP